MNQNFKKFSNVLIFSGMFVCLTAAVVVGLSVIEKRKDEGGIVNMEKTAIIPMPQSYKKMEGEFILMQDTKLIVSANDKNIDEILKNANYLKDKLDIATGYNLEIAEGKVAEKNSIFLKINDSLSDLGDEGYKISVTDKNITIEGYKVEGIFRGMQTLRQSLPPEIESNKLVWDVVWSIEAAEIVDKPEYNQRGLMIDVARHFFSVEDIKRQIDIASAYKINTLHLHLSDDQGWRLEIKKWQDLTKIGGMTEVGGDEGGYYTQDQFKDIVKYANERYIDIIPEFDMPGHTNAMLASYGFLNENGEKANPYIGTNVGFSSLMCKDEKTYQMIEDIIKEVSEISPSQYIHIGGDEAHSTSKEDYEYFISRVVKIVQKYGKTPIGWDPINTVEGITDELITQYWSNTEYDNNKGKKAIISKADKLYLDMKYDENSNYGLTWAGYNDIKDSYEWDPQDYAAKEDILGIEAPLWTETINNSKAMDYMIYPRLIGHAEVGWTVKDKRNYDEYEKRLRIHGKRLENMGVNYYKDKLFDK